MVSGYFADLLGSTIPLPRWMVFAIWLLLLAIGHALFRLARARSATQSYIVVGESAVQRRTGSARGVVLQVLFGTVLIGAVSFLGDIEFAIIAGGWVVTTAASIGLNLRSALFLRAITEPSAASGTINLSARLALRDSSFQLFGVAALVLALGVLLAQLALLGGALFTAATGLGYLRRANALRP